MLITPVPGHFSYDTYSNPYTFDVTRCMPPRNEHLNRGVFAPFGVGKRVCAGTGMCEIVAFATVSSVMLGR